MVFTRWTASARRDVRCPRVNYTVKERGGQGRLQTGSLGGAGGGGKGGMTDLFAWKPASPLGAQGRRECGRPTQERASTVGWELATSIRPLTICVGAAPYHLSPRGRFRLCLSLQRTLQSTASKRSPYSGDTGCALTIKSDGVASASVLWSVAPWQRAAAVVIAGRNVAGLVTQKPRNQNVDDQKHRRNANNKYEPSARCSTARCQSLHGRGGLGPPAGLVRIGGGLRMCRLVCMSLNRCRKLGFIFSAGRETAGRCDCDCLVAGE